MRRSMILFAGLAGLALLLVPATSGASGGPHLRAQPTSSSAGLQAQGRTIYLQSCAACHGPDPNGPSAYSTVPSLKDVGGAAAVDWAVRTGRMPFRSTAGEAIAPAANPTSASRSSARWTPMSAARSATP